MKNIHKNFLLYYIFHFFLRQKLLETLLRCKFNGFFFYSEIINHNNKKKKKIHVIIIIRSKKDHLIKIKMFSADFSLNLKSVQHMHSFKNKNIFLSRGMLKILLDFNFYYIFIVILFLLLLL